MIIMVFKYRLKFGQVLYGHKKIHEILTPALKYKAFIN